MGDQAAEQSGKLALDANLVSFQDPCPYLPGRSATLEGFFAGRIPAGFYRQLMDLSFRRSGRFFYRPKCIGCSECTPLRVLVDEFAPSRSQRRCRSRNQDMTVELGRPDFTVEKFELYSRYVEQKHGDRGE